MSLSKKKEFFNAYVATEQHVIEPDLSFARLQTAYDLVHLKIPTALPAPHFFISEGDWIKVLVYLNINQTVTYARSLIGNFQNCKNLHSIPVCFSNRLIEALYDYEQVFATAPASAQMLPTNKQEIACYKF